MGYVVAHCRKVQTIVGLAAVGRHNCREAVYDEQGRPLGELPEYITHPERAGMNEGERCGSSAILKNRTDRIREADLTRKPQRNASAAVEVSISASPEWFDGRKPEDWSKYFRDARKFLTEKYGKENLLHWTVHYDEKSPHMHVLFTPIVEGKAGLKYTSSEFLGGRQGLRELQDEIAAKVGAKWGLERGVEGSGARHTDQYQWAAETDALASRLAAKEQALAQKESHLKKASEVKIPPFVPKLEKKTLASALLTYTLSNGKQVNGWEAYAAAETALQATAYAEKVAEVAKGAQYRVATVEAELPYAHQAAAKATEEREAIRAQLKALTPDQLRAEADRREAQLARGKQRDKGHER
jgi:hypothetical protein